MAATVLRQRQCGEGARTQQQTNILFCPKMNGSRQKKNGGTLRRRLNQGTRPVRLHCLLKSTVGAEWAFSRLDLITVIGVVGLLFLWFGMWQFGEHGRITRCAANLRALGQATQSFATDQQNALPPAVIDAGHQQITWDARITPSLPQNLLKHGSEPLFRCPSDRLVHFNGRSYTMSAHDMQLENWPPGPENDTGVGLVWNQETIRKLLDQQQSNIVATNVDFGAMMKRSLIPSPSKTLLLTELISYENNLKGITWAAISGPGEQVQQFVNKKAYVHNGRFNYLMLDGHVELLSPLQTTAPNGGGIWSIRKSN